MSLMNFAAQIARSSLKTERVKYGPWRGSMRSVPADRVPRDHISGGADFHYMPRTGYWRRRLGQTIKFDTFTSSVGLLPAKWSSKCRQLDEFKSDSISDGIPTLIALLTRETISSGLDDGRFGQVWIRDQVGNTNYTLGAEYGTTHYPAPGTAQRYKVTPLWYDSGDGGITRGTSEFARRFFVSGARGFLKVGNQWYVPNLLGTPFRWEGRFNTATGSGSETNRLMPSGPIPPTHAGVLTATTQIETNITFGRPDADVTVTNWTDNAGGGSNLYTTIDEATVNDLDYIKTDLAVTGAVYECTTTDLGFTPSPDDTVAVSYRVMRSAGIATLRVDLVQGTTIIATQTQTPGAAYFVHLAMTLTPTQISAITDWTDLRIRFTKAHVSGASSQLYVSYAALEHTPSVSVATAGGWRGSDKFYYSVAYRFEDDSIWMPVTPRGPNDTLTNGFCLFTVDAANASASYQKVVWSSIPIGPHGTKSRILLRSPKIDSTTDSTLQLNPQDLRVVWEIKDNTTTTYDDYFADDDSLGLDADHLLIRDDHIMPPRARYIFGGDARVCHSYGGLNPCAVVIAPVGRAADYDLNLADDAAAAYNQNSSYMRVAIASDGTGSLLLGQSTGAVFTTRSLAFATYDTLEKLVDKINSSVYSDSGGQWRAQIVPGANPQASCLTALTPHARFLTSVVVTSGQATVTRAAGGLSKVPVGAVITDSAGVYNSNFADGTYVLRIDSDTQLTMSAAASGTATATVGFAAGLGDAPVAGEVTYQRVIGNALPGFLYFTHTYLAQFPIEKSSVWMTVASPGAVKSAPNCFSGKIDNKHTPPTAAGISMGGAAVDNGFVVPFSQKNCAIRNTRDTGSGIDSDYKLFVLNEARGCCAWQTVAAGNRFVSFVSPEGVIACDLFNEMALSDAIWVHSPNATGDFDYEMPLSIGATGKDDDTAYLSAKIVRSQLWLSYRASGSHPNRQVVYDFSSGHESSGLRGLLRSTPLVDWADGRVVAPAGSLFGWSLPLTRSVTAMCEGRRGDGSHLYAWNEANAGSAGDGRVDELETTNSDNGVNFNASVTTPWERLGRSGRVSAQEITVEHTTTGGAITVDATNDGIYFNNAPPPYLTATIAHATYGTLSDYCYAAEQAMWTAYGVQNWRVVPGWTIVTGRHDTLIYSVKITGGAAADMTATIAAGAYTSANDVAREVAAAMNRAEVARSGGALVTFDCTSDGSKFTITATATALGTATGLDGWILRRVNIYSVGCLATLGYQMGSAAVTTPLGTGLVSDFATAANLITIAFSGLAGKLGLTNAAFSAAATMGMPTTLDKTVGSFTATTASGGITVVALDFHRGLADSNTYTMTPSSSSLVYIRDVKPLSLAARVSTQACYIGWRQSSGTPSELRSIELRAKPLPSYN